jgi:hypothetical protein
VNSEMPLVFRLVVREVSARRVVFSGKGMVPKGKGHAKELRALVFENRRKEMRPKVLKPS